MFKPKNIYYEEGIEKYPLGKYLLEKYPLVPKYIIGNHNNIPELRKSSNKDFPRLKQNLIIGTRKTHKFVPNKKVSDYLVPYTSSGCTAMCLYCYLVCHYNKCAYLRLFVNREEMLDKIIKVANSPDNTSDLVFEIGSNSDLILENTITGNLDWTITEFSKSPKGKLTFPTKFHMVDSILNLPGKEKIIPRVSVNPDKIIKQVEFKTSSLDQRITAINKLCDAGFKTGILIAPVILIDNWKILYENLLKKLSKELSKKAKDTIFFEIIFMTYSYVHNEINKEAFPYALKIYNPAIFTSRGRYKYTYKDSIKSQATVFLQKKLNQYFPNAKILYIA